MINLVFKLTLIFLISIIVGCSNDETESPAAESANADENKAAATQVPVESTKVTNRTVNYTEEREPCADYQPERKALFGELHVHTAFSFDAAAGRTRTMPEDAYRFAQGETIPYFPLDENGNPGGTIKIDRPLDFAAITDHGEFLGETKLCKEPDSPTYNDEICKNYRKAEFRGAAMLATAISGDYPKRIELLCGEDGKLCREYARAPWQHIVDAAEDAYDRSSECRFTSFVGYEYTGSPFNSNYHRNVIFRNGNVPALPISYIEAPFDYMLWEQMEEVCNKENNCDYLTIPHNSNISNGRLLTPYANLEPTLENRQAYARERQENEPIMEVFQHKGSSECMNGLSNVIGAPDELCDVEQIRQFGKVTTAIDLRLENADVVFDRKMVGTAECVEIPGKNGMMGGGCVSSNDFMRTALLTGLAEQQKIDINPVKLGVIAASDGHTGTPGAVVEDDWRGFVTGEMTRSKRLKPGTLPSGILGNPGGLAGVWAVENSRDAIFEAMQRREVFGTSGTRILPRFFGGWEFAENSCESTDMIKQGYSMGVPMGGDLTVPSKANALPTFIVSALRDPSKSAAPLKMLQVVKGWVNAEGTPHYKVFDVAGSPNSEAGVNTDTGERFGDGHSSLCGVFTDEEFDPSVPSYYYLRVVENPSPRWSLLDCLQIEASKRPKVCQDTSKHVIHEMAWTSPIWYSPKTQQQ